MKSFARKAQTLPPSLLPASWGNTVKGALHQIYQKEIESRRLCFDVYGATFPDEVLILATLTNPDDLTITPVTLSLSSDLTSVTESEKLIRIMVDKISDFYDSYFLSLAASEEIEIYAPKWTEHEERGVVIFAKCTRENIQLTLEANRLLGDDFDL